MTNSFGLVDEADQTRSRLYSSGLGDKDPTTNDRPGSAFALLRIPIKFRLNDLNNPLKEGFYELQPIFVNNKPIKINFRQNGKLLGSISVVDFNIIDYSRKSAIAEINIINNNKMGEISLKVDKYEIFAIINGL